jgi:creatinine amidohydrolase
MLALHPALVHTEAAAAGYSGPTTPEVLARMFQDGIASIAPNGILGDARGMSAAIGRRCIAEAVEMLVQHFRRSLDARPHASGEAAAPA